MKKEICRKCGGTLHFEECKLCDLFASGYDGVFVEKERLNNPKLSDALACHPKHAQKMRDELKKRGVPTDIRNDGRPVITSRAHQKAICKALGVHNRDGSYGD